MKKSLANRRARRRTISREKWSISKVLDHQDVMKHVLQDWLSKSNFLRFLCSLPKSKEGPLQELTDLFVYTKALRLYSLPWIALFRLRQRVGIRCITSCNLERESFCPLSAHNSLDMLCGLEILSLSDLMGGFHLDLLVHFRQLKELSLTSTIIALLDTSPQYLSEFLPNLCKLSIFACQIQRSVLFATQVFAKLAYFSVRSCSIDGAGNSSIATLLPYITEFCPRTWHQEEKESFDCTSALCVKLAKLRICGSSIDGSDFANAVYARSPVLKSLEVSHFYSPATFMNCINIKHFLPIQELILRRVTLGAPLFGALAKHCPHLTTVVYEDCKYDSSQQPANVDTMPYFRRLQSLSILYSSSSSSSSWFSDMFDHLQLAQPYANLQKVSFMQSSCKGMMFYVKFLSLCPQLTSLHLQSAKLFDILVALVDNAQHLTHLVELVLEKYCRQAERVRIFHRIIKLVSQFPPIRRLVLRRCNTERRNEDPVDFIGKLLDFFANSLESLHLQHCSPMPHWSSIISHIVKSQLNTGGKFRELVWELDAKMPNKAVRMRKQLLWQLFRDCQQQADLILRTSLYRHFSSDGKDGGLHESKDVLVLRRLPSSLIV
eukprot:gene27319-33000_t